MADNGRMARITARLAKATPGPWHWTFVPGDEGNVCVKHDHYDVYRNELQTNVKRNEPGIAEAEIESTVVNVGCYLGESADAILIANAPADLTWLINRLRVAENMLSTFRDHGEMSGDVVVLRDVEEIDAFLAEREHTRATFSVQSRSHLNEEVK